MGKTVVVTVRVEIDRQAWADEYGVELEEVKADAGSYLQTAIYSMPCEPVSVRWR